MGSHAREGLGEHQDWKRCVAVSFSLHDLANGAPEAELVRWNTDGTLFVVQTMSTLDVYTTVRTNPPPPARRVTLRANVPHRI